MTIIRRPARWGIALRKERKMGLGDAIIAATALVHGLRRVTRNGDDFKHIAGLELINPFVQTGWRNNRWRRKPITAEGHKGLVFSPFIQMPEIIRAEIGRRELAVFPPRRRHRRSRRTRAEFPKYRKRSRIRHLASRGRIQPKPHRGELRRALRSAMENQAIDRTRRIGQTSHVIAYRLLVEESIEEKIRTFQRSKSSLAADILDE